MPTNDPVMALADRLPLAVGTDPTAATTAVTPATPSVDSGAPVPFGLKFAVDPIVPTGKHEKTHYTVTVKEATNINEDGTVVTVQDDVEKERQD